MKIIAYFLPQFHEIPENNEWWGKGFTEWTNIKKAKSLYKGHEQPIVPLNKNYYNLLEKKTMLWQTKVLNEFGIYGLCYYHYWFNGKMLLEKPVENLLKWQEINQKFCFCWANHSWRKTWKGSKEILLQQDYGTKEEWDLHLQYLMKYFKDKRYIKINNKPVFMIFDTKNFENMVERLNYYNEKCKENGFEGIYLIKSINKKEEKVESIFNGVTLREPNIGINNLNFFEKLEYRIKRRIKNRYILKPKVFKANKIYSSSLEVLQNYSKINLFLGSFNLWDSTPRHGKRGFVIEQNNIEHFRKYLIEQKKIMLKNNIEYMFFNAWNEWAEGMYLEPDEKNGYKYLEIIKEVIETEV